MNGWRIERQLLMNAWMVHIGISIVLVGLALYDLKRCRVPNLIIMPLLTAVIPLNITRIVAGEGGSLGLIAVVWAVCLFLWAMRIFGAGDMKLVMVLIGIFPEIWMVNILVGVLMAGHFVILLSRDGWTSVRRLEAIVMEALVTKALPTPAEIRAVALARRSPVTYLISIAGLIYIWATVWLQTMTV